MSKLGRHSSAVVCPEALLATAQAVKQAMEKGLCHGKMSEKATARKAERMSDSASANRKMADESGSASGTQFFNSTYSF